MKVFISLFALFAFLPAAQAEQALVLNSAFSTPITSPASNGALDKLYQTLGSRAGINFQIQSLPAERALINANTGIEDGDVCRIAGLEKTYPNLIMVPGAIMHFQMSAFTRSPDIKFSGLDSLKPYHVGFLIGWKTLEKKIVGTKALSQFATDGDLLRALEKGLIDVAILEKSQGISRIRADSGIRLLQPALIKGDCYCYLSKKHSRLIPLLATELKKMKQDGSYRKIFQDVMQPYSLGHEY
jgi:polar amino acid transport system substrate-binding protein